MTLILTLTLTLDFYFKYVLNLDFFMYNSTKLYILTTFTKIYQFPSWCQRINIYLQSNSIFI